MADRKSKYDDGEVRVRYADNEVRCNFDLRKLLDEHHAARRSGSRGGSSLSERRRELRRLVGKAGMTLAEAKLHDFDAWADDMPRLKALHAEWLSDPANKPKIGTDFTKGIILVSSPSGHGKGILADGVAAQMVGLAALSGGRKWSIAEPAGRNAIEDVRGAEVVIHDDARFWLLPTHDEFLRWLDPNRVTAAATRNTNTPAPAPRAIVLTTSNTLYEFALTVFLRKPSDALAENACFRSGSTNIDEFLRRIGWLVEVRTPDWVLVQEGRIPKTEFVALIRAEMVVSILRMRVSLKRSLHVVDREGTRLGSASATREPELIAVLRGSEVASRFLAVSLVEECSPDIWAEIPSASAQAITSERQAIQLAGLQLAVEVGRGAVA
ncbi:hypothetical protein QN367_06825 [Cryobacterium sp. RTS3]|uniref:hypothetical protein n=1 Tax=Cryobacterium sp. RTS3 TaxID=3048643 RepID=UPI002B22877F|nr:hypothetical protein [Cryobacterium sp. RTS3]MEA9998806.1 hypothetical protein [Cryobacterium sp. RTS3]